MRRFIKNFIIFVICCLFQVFFQGNFFVKPIVDLFLIFLILSFFDFPFVYLVFLILIRGIIFDSLSGLSWGVNLLSLGLAFGLGFFMLNFFERENFISKIILGEVIMGSYWLILFLSSLVLGHQNFGITIFIDFLINGILYLSILFCSHYVFAKKNYHSR